MRVGYFLKPALYAFGVGYDQSSKQGIRLIINLIKKHQLILFLLLISGVSIAIMEGATIAILAASVIVITSKDNSCPELLVRALDFFGMKHCNDFDKYQLFIWMVLLAVFIQVVKALAIYISGYLAVILRTRIAFDMRIQIVSKLLLLSYEQSATISAGEKQALINRSTKLASMVPFVNEFIVTVFVLITYFVILFTMNWQLFLVAFFMMSIVFIIVTPFFQKIRKLSFQARTNSNYLLKRVIDYMFALRLVKLYAKEDDVLKNIKHIISKEIGFFRSTSLYSLAVGPIQETIIVCSMAVILLLSYFLGGESVEEFLPSTLAFLLVLNRSNSKVAALNYLRDNFSKNMPSVQYVSDFLHLNYVSEFSEKVTKVNKDWNFIKFRDVNFSYASSEMNQLNDVNFEIKRGDSIAFVGSSGAGKSTLVDLLTGLIMPTFGNIALDNENLNVENLQSWRSQFAMVSQNDLILNDTVMTNLLFANENASREEIINACKLADAHDFIESLGDSYETVLGEKGFKLSGGQIQRIAFARALLAGTPILVLDEATSALDTITEQKIIQALDVIDKSKTVIMIAHRLSTVIHADKIFVLEQGSIIDSGSHSELIGKDGVYKKMWSLQSN